MKLRTLLTAAVIALASVSFAQLEKLEGKSAPKFKMTDTNGKVLTNKSLKGKVIILDFWATWCGPCKAASPAMDALQKKYKKDLVVIGANMGDRGSTTAAPEYKKEHKYSYTFTSKNDKLAGDLGIQSIPAFVIIDKKGNVSKTFVGWGDQMVPIMDSAVKKLIAAKK